MFGSLTEKGTFRELTDITTTHAKKIRNLVFGTVPDVRNTLSKAKMLYDSSLFYEFAFYMYQIAATCQAFWGETENPVRKQIHLNIITYYFFAIIELDLELTPVVFVMLLLNSSLLAKDNLLKVFSQKSEYMNDSGQLDLAFNC